MTENDLTDMETTILESSIALIAPSFDNSCNILPTMPH